MKLTKVVLKNFRGTRGESPLTLNLEQGYSVLLYGDNGTGKSSFTDALEWVLTDSVQHLGGNEIEKHGGLKNTFTTEKDESYALFEFDNQTCLQKHLVEKKGKFTAKFDNPERDEPISGLLKSEHLFIRNTDLIQFILATSGKRLADISDIIGFQDLKNTKAILSKAANSLNSSIKAKNFEASIANNKNKIFEKIKATVNSKEQLYASIANELKEVKLNTIVTDEESLKEALQELKKGVNEDEIIKRKNIDESEKGLIDAFSKIKSYMTDLAVFAEDLKKVTSKKEMIESISIIKLLKEGEKIISTQNNDECPLCERTIDKETLLALIKDRLKALQETQEQINNLTEDKRTLKTIFVDINETLEKALNLLNELKLDNVDIQKLTADLSCLKKIKTVLGEDILAIEENELTLKESDIKSLDDTIQSLKKIGKSGRQQETEKRIELYYAIKASCDAFEEILKLEKEKKAIESQKESMDKILTLFNEVRKNEMEKFLNEISKNVNEYYLYMNHAEKVDEIQLNPSLNSDGDLTGISIELKFHGHPVSTPKKFLSESYINCLGLCIFLASVKLFNKKAKFFLLDDVISSFDKPHRIRFGQLLEEKFSDYQVIVLTHEHEWFELMRNAVKGKGWKIIRTQWNVEEGTYLDLSPGGYKEEIEKMLNKKQETGLGNLIRRYAEKCFKELCYNLEVPMRFHYNDKNENRMLGELFPAIRSRVNKKSDFLKDKPVLKKLENLSFITNKLSHDSSIKENIDDLKVAYKDVDEFYNLFCCENCGCLVNRKFVSASKKAISCRCGEKEFDWK